jgi:hypothetical protein
MTSGLVVEQVVGVPTVCLSTVFALVKFLDHNVQAAGTGLSLGGGGGGH